MSFPSTIFLIPYSFYCGYTLTRNRIRCPNYSIMSQFLSNFTFFCVPMLHYQLLKCVYMDVYKYTCKCYECLYQIWVRVCEFAKPIWLCGSAIPTGAELNSIRDHTVLPSRRITSSGGSPTISNIRLSERATKSTDFSARHTINPNYNQKKSFILSIRGASRDRDSTKPSKSKRFDKQEIHS